MQVRRILNNNYNTNFGANLQISGKIDDITDKMFNEWAKKAKEIGQKTDTIHIKFRKPKKDDYVLHERVNTIECHYIKRSIIGNIIFTYRPKMKEQRIGYRANGNEHTHEEMTTKLVNYFLDSLKEQIQK